MDMAEKIGMMPRELESIQNAQFSKPCFNEVLENSAKLTFTWKTHPWVGIQGFWKQWEITGGVLCLGTESFLLFGRGLGLQGQIFLCVLFKQHHSELCDSYKGYNYIHFEMHCKYSARWCNWHRTQTEPLPLKCPTSFFTLQHFKWLQTELPETVVNSWHLKFPWSQLACKKKAVSFFPLKIMYFPGTVQMPQIRQMRDLFWPTNEKTSPLPS